MRKPRLSGSSLIIALLAVLCTFLLIANTKLIRVTKQLEAHASSIDAGKGPVIGSRMTRLSDTSTLLNPATHKTARKGSLVLVFSPDCGYCKANVPNWNKLVVNHPDLNVYFADLTSGPRSRSLPGLILRSDAVMISLKPEDQLLYNLHVTPTTVILDRSGTVKGSWPGLLSSTNLDQMDNLVKSIQG